ncbi:hypothetical protein ACFS5M_12325 [Lacinutrix iliipiscaria]|uniref:Lipoprotein n=1 Tax=Lacinutrix iliipiscaria TaxID=1230532 RepID=A0ABW5WR85_9FLAO
MKQKRFKNYLKLGLLLFGVSLMFVNCQKDDDFKNEQTNQNINPYKISKISLNDIKRKGHFEIVKPKIKTKEEIENIQNLKTYNSIYNFKIDTDYVTYIENSDGSYHSYTFPVIYEIAKDSLDNLLISLQKDGTYSAFLVKYNTTPQEKLDIEDGNPVDLTDKVFYTAIDDDVLIKSILNDEGLNTNLSNKEACGQTIVTSCYYEVEAHEDGHFPSGGPCNGWQMVITNNSCEAGSGGTGGYTPPDGNQTFPNTGNTNTNTGATNNGGSNTQENDDVTSPITTCTRDCPEEVQPEPCEKIINLFEDYPTYKDELIALAAKRFETVENGIFIDTGNDAEPVENLPTGTNGFVNFDACNNSNRIISVAHTHNSPSTSTYSIFSDGDLRAFAKGLQCGKIKTNKFVAFLITADGTYYALTIDNVSKLKEYYHFLPLLNPPYDIEKQQEYFNSYNEYLPMFNDYFNEKENPDSKIKKGSEDNLVDEKAFLEMILNYDLGVSLFEVNDNFDDFTKVTLDTTINEIIPEDCPN